jgi:L-alanine-DL-glutamate epimerase-like enolase superfamily enzyme
MAIGSSAVPIEHVEVSAYKIATDAPESDGTYQWDSTTIVVVEATAGGVRSLGYSYADGATAHLVQELLAATVTGLDALSVPTAWTRMVEAVRNLGHPGIAAMAISAVDNSLWDLKARLLGQSLASLLGRARDGVPVYGSGGFTSYSRQQLQDQLGGWAREGFGRVKMKIGRDPDHDLERVRWAREAIGPDTELFVDANGAYHLAQALWFAERFAHDYGVSWFEEPRPSDDLAGLRWLRDRAPGGLQIAAGEYGYELLYFRRMLDAGAVHVQQADATRCSGISGFLAVGALCQAHLLPMSAHCAPTLHMHACCALPAVVNLEYFHDHARIEHMLFDGASTPVKGILYPDLSRPGLGLELKRQDAERWRIGI